MKSFFYFKFTNSVLSRENSHFILNESTSSICCHKAVKKVDLPSPYGTTNLASILSNILADSLDPTIIKISTSQKKVRIFSFSSKLSLVIIKRCFPSIVKL
ncbi:hypothetical protein HOB94_06480 [bacterium]|nr:hypothetical protein [bacterium]